MSWWKEVSHIGHHIDEGISGILGGLNKIGHEIFGGGPGHEDEGGTDFYVGYNSNSGFSGYAGPGQKYESIPNNKPAAYTANAAKTASSIKQGGMTKDELIDFNIKHPNETALRG